MKRLSITAISTEFYEKRLQNAAILEKRFASSIAAIAENIYAVELKSNENILTILSVDLLFNLLRILSGIDLCSVAGVSKRCYSLANHQYIWRLLAERTFQIPNILVHRDFNWKLYYREKTAMMKPINWVSMEKSNEQTDANVLLPPPRQSHGTTPVDNKIVIMGGHQVLGESFMRHSDIWVYDTITNEFSEIHPTTTVPIPVISRHRLVAINNLVYSFGGILQNKSKLNTIYKLDLQSNTWSSVEVKAGTPPEPRCDSVVVVYNKKIIVYGGSVSDLIFPSDVHVFDTETSTWEQPTIKGESPSPRIGCTGVVKGNILYVYGGGNYDRAEKKYVAHYKEIWTLNLITYEWTLVSLGDVLPSVTDFLNSVFIGHHIIIEGGWFSGVHAYDTVTNQWSKLECEGGLKLNNNETSATLINDGIYYYGGFYNGYKHHLKKMDVSHLKFLLNT